MIFGEIGAATLPDGRGCFLGGEWDRAATRATAKLFLR